jgi:hypothetical protein
MLYIYIKEVINRLSFIIFGIFFTTIISIIYKEELIYILFNYYFKIFKFQILLLTGIFDKIYIELLIIYFLIFITSILLFVINFILFCIPIITNNKLYIILKNILLIIIIFLFYCIINLFFIFLINIIKNNNNNYIFLESNIINEIRLVEYKNFIFIILLSNFTIFLIGLFIFFSIKFIINISYNYFKNIRLFNFFLLSIFLIFIIPPDYILHSIILIYYFCYIEGLFILSIYIIQYNYYKKKK